MVRRWGSVVSLFGLGATDVVTVILNRATVDSRGRASTEEVGRVLATGRLQPIGQSDIDRYAGSGVAVQDTVRFSTSNFPGDDISEVIDRHGVTYAVVGAPRRERSSRRTQRDVVLLRAKTLKRKW